MSQPLEMTELEARALATKREAHRSKHLGTKHWRAVNDPVKGWHAALVEDQSHIYRMSRLKAQQALLTGDFEAFQAAARDNLMAKVRLALDE